MSVNNFLFFVVPLCLLQFNQKNNYFLLEENPVEYVYFINGEKEEDSFSSKKIESFFITSKGEYNNYLKTKSQNSINGEPSNLFGLTFMAESKEVLSICELEKLNRKSFKWLWEQKRKVTKDYIELNDFKDLRIIIKKGDSYVAYKVRREFSSH